MTAATILQKCKWMLTHVAWLVAGLILIIDPKHIDEIALKHPQWSAFILALWTAAVAWATRAKPKLPAKETQTINRAQGSRSDGN